MTSWLPSISSSLNSPRRFLPNPSGSLQRKFRILVDPRRIKYERGRIAGTSLKKGISLSGKCSGPKRYDALPQRL
jgi:hypothetical protein